MGDFEGFLPFSAPKLPLMGRKKKIAVAAIAVVLAAAFWWDFLVPHAAYCESDANCTPANASEMRVGVRHLCVNHSCVERAFGNPASEKCEADGGTVRFKENENGTRGICVLPDGSECDEWQYFRGECGAVNQSG
ncbi:MAG: DUF333 domain-containing protein [Candidatus Norongarragalinales archaeon]